MQARTPVFRRGSRPFARSVGFIAAICFAVWLVFSYFIAYGFVHPVKLPAWETPSDYQMPGEDVSFASDENDRLVLRGWFVPAEGKPRGVLVLCHGRQGTRADMLRHAQYLREAGFSCLTFSFRACGDSPGDTSTIGWQEVGDALGAVRYLKSRSDTRNLPLGIYGSSMGAAVAIQAGAKSPLIRAVAADSSYTRLDRAIDQRFRGLMGFAGPIFAVPVSFFGERMTGMHAHDVAPLAVVAQIAPRPLFLIHGKSDILIRYRDSEELYRAAGQPKTLWLVPDAGHVQNFALHPDEYRRRLTEFFVQALCPPKPQNQAGTVSPDKRSIVKSNASAGKIP